ncbi:hypothetical protein AX14_012789 [Amanita brunnescens Koide BX004]|nr:hypothetical protein AX14_013725 [Amanita brunnescens Koide BX004]KAF8714397.1 hypothetical protein AX14_012789 [Amanita brunnescens Koide BX004]
MADLVTTTIIYGVPPADGARAFGIVSADPRSKTEENYTRQNQEVQVENIRGREDTVSLDTAGFQFYTIPTKYKGDFLDEEEIKREYFPESEELLKKLTGASKVFNFDYTVRHYQPHQPDTGPFIRQPVPRVHVDQTLEAAIARVHRHFPEEASVLLERRFQIINLWRPISVPALDWPLALCDFRSVDPENDLFPVVRFFPHHQSEAYSVKNNPNHKWKYLRGMTPDEFVLVKCCDSIQDGSVARFAAHAAFQDPTTPQGAPHRQSIEIRFLVFYD